MASLFGNKPNPASKLSSSQSKQLEMLSKQWFEANRRGDKAAMENAHAAANTVREAAGMVKGTEYNSKTGEVYKKSSGDGSVGLKAARDQYKEKPKKKSKGFGAAVSDFLATDAAKKTAATKKK